MTGISLKARTKAREKIEKAIENSVMESPASVNEIAEKTGYHPSLVHRVFIDLGWHWEGRWVWRHNPPKGE